MNNNILCIGDLHEPFSHPDSLDFTIAVADHYQTDTIICLGDEIDSHALSRYNKDPDGKSARDEHSLAISRLERFYRIFPDVKVCTSNHTNRVYRKAFDAGIPQGFIKEYGEMLQAPTGWEWADRWEVDDIIFEHGEGYSGMYAHRHAAVANMRSTVIGHLHAHAGIQYVDNKDKSIFGFNVGCLIDESQYAFSYAKTFRYKPSIGIGVIDYGTPIWLPMKRGKNNRWIGEL